MRSASASEDTVINKSTLYVQSGLKYNLVANVQKEFITIHYIGSQDNNNFSFFFRKGWDAVLLVRLLGKRFHSWLPLYLNIRCPNQFGFRQNHSTVLALIDVIDDIYSHLENNEYVLGMYLDLQKAFDMVDHTIYFGSYIIMA